MLHKTLKDSLKAFDKYLLEDLVDDECALLYIFTAYEICKLEDNGEFDFLVESIEKVIKAQGHSNVIASQRERRDS